MPFALTCGVPQIKLFCFHKKLQHERIKVRDVFLKLVGNFVLFHKIQPLNNAVSCHYIGYRLGTFNDEGVLVDILDRSLEGRQHRSLHHTHTSHKP